MDMIFREGVYYDGLISEAEKDHLRYSPLWPMVQAIYKSSVGNLRVAKIWGRGDVNDVTALFVDKYGNYCLSARFYRADNRYELVNPAQTMKSRGKDRYSIKGKTVSYVMRTYNSDALQSIIDKETKDFEQLLGSVINKYKDNVDVRSFTFQSYCDEPRNFEALFGVLFENKSLDCFEPLAVRELESAHRNYCEWRQEKNELMEEINETFCNPFFYVGHYDAYVGVGVYKFVDQKPVAVVPYRLYKSLDAVTGEVGEQLKMSMAICRLNREQVSNKVQSKDGIPFGWETMVYRDTTSMSFGSSIPSIYSPSMFVTPY